jgi:hypothetical protein
MEEKFSLLATEEGRISKYGDSCTQESNVALVVYVKLDVCQSIMVQNNLCSELQIIYLGVKLLNKRAT